MKTNERKFITGCIWALGLSQIVLWAVYGALLWQGWKTLSLTSGGVGDFILVLCIAVAAWACHGIARELKNLMVHLYQNRDDYARQLKERRGNDV